ncbi:MAG TPA: adenylyl-sulfate kinase [Flavisolibacter sp.]|nr:adenylyl-sulfate kinase [Flavisolibacter sp.]
MAAGLSNFYYSMRIIQLTGLSGAGKTTLATRLHALLQEAGFPAVVIDADVYRKTVNKDLGFSAADRKENIRRLAAIAHDYSSQGTIAILAAINPFEEVRQEVARRYGAKTVWIRCSLDMLIQRDTKGLYRKAFLPEGHPEKLKNLTGVNDPYEEPLQPDLIINTDEMSEAEAVNMLLQFALAMLKSESL